MEPIKVSVIIPTLNAGNTIELLINKLLTQQQKIDQIIVVDSGSTDQTAAIASKLKVELISIEPGTFDHGVTRNLAAEQALGNRLVFMTQDALPANDETIGKLLDPLQDQNIVVAYARQLAGEKATLSDRYLRLANYPPEAVLKSKENISTMGIRAFQNSNVCSAYRRREFEALGRFPAPAVCNEDMIFAARAIFAGFAVFYNADALVYHTHHFTLKQLFRRYFDIAASLDLEPRIGALGKTETKGLEYLKGYLEYLREQKKQGEIPRAFFESLAKYLGYKAGTKHQHLPATLLKRCGSNTIFWNRIIEDKKHQPR